MRAFIRDQAEPYADEHAGTDALGNLIVFKKGAKSTGYQAAAGRPHGRGGHHRHPRHRRGLSEIRLCGRGRPPGRSSASRWLLGQNRVPGVIGLKAIHLISQGGAEKACPRLDELYIDIGAQDREAAHDAGRCWATYGVFDSEPVEFGGGLLKAKAIDDRVGCAVMLELLKEELPLDVTFAFTAQEEVGTRGAFGAAFSVTPEVALVLETTTAADLPGVRAGTAGCAPRARGRSSPIWTAAPSTTGGCSEPAARSGGGQRHPLADQGVYRRGHRRPHHPAQPGRRSGGGHVRRQCVTCTPPPAWPACADMENMLELTRLFLGRAGPADWRS